MRNTLVIGAAALIAGAGIASAQTQLPQGDQKAPGATPPPAAIQRAPAEKTGDPLQKSQDRATTGQGTPQVKQPNAQAPAGANPKAASDADMKAKGKAATDNNNANKSATDNKAATDSKSNAATGSKSTTGQGSAATAGANLSTEQRTKITTVIREQKVQPVTNVNFSIAVGTHVPRSVHLYPLPAPVIAVYPAWRGYKFILVGDEIVVIHPETFAIVAVLQA